MTTGGGPGPRIGGNSMPGLPMPPLPPIPGGGPNARGASGNDADLTTGFRSNVGAGLGNHTIADQARNTIITRGSTLEQLARTIATMTPDQRDTAIGQIVNIHLDLKKAMGNATRFPNLWKIWQPLDVQLSTMLANVNIAQALFPVDPSGWPKVKTLAKKFNNKAVKNID